MRARFVCVAARAGSAGLAERAVAEAFEAGASGLEERVAGEATLLLLYAPAERAEALHAALAPLGLELGAPIPVEEVDWASAWRVGLEAIVVSPRLAIRPSSVVFAPGPGQATLVVDPAQAFGTGGHASTRLALELLDALAVAGRLADARLLDVGCGTGVLALAALRLGARRAVALDHDPLATRAAAENAVRNGLRPALELCCGSLAALRAPAFDVVVANLLRSELLPLLPQLARALESNGSAVFSGLLAAEQPELSDALAAVGLVVCATHTRSDAAGDTWLALLTRHRAAAATRRAGAAASRRTGSSAPSR